MDHLGASIEFQMSLLLFAALAGCLLAYRIRQPAVVGVILAGILIGPTGFGFITYSHFVESLGHIGAAVLLFVIGLECQVKKMTKPRYFFIALGGVLVPWIGGCSIALFFDFPMAKAIIIGVALCATSLAITADTLREMGKLHTEAAQAIIGAAIMDDVLALLALAMAQEVASGEVHYIEMLVFFIKAMAFIGFSLIFGSRLFERLIRYIDQSDFGKENKDTVFTLAMVIAFFFAMLAELMGLSSIVGAFIAGIMLEQVRTVHSRDFREGAHFMRVIFGAMFFISLGVLADFRDMTWGAAGFAISMTIVAYLSKLIGCGVPAKLSGMNMQNAVIVGIGMGPRGEVAMTIALLAYAQDIIAQPAFTSLIIMSLLTAVLVPMMLRQAFKKVSE